MEHLLVLIVMGNKGSDATLVLKSDRFRIILIAVIMELNTYTFIQKGEFSEPVAKRIV